jgi:gamma-glutamyltranspeptidase/glutathione hydrolase
LASAFLAPAIATLSDGSLALAGAGAGGPNGTAALAYALLQLASGEDITTKNQLKSTGVAPYDTVNVITCDHGTCAVLPDPGGHGLGATATTR